jgi:prepilin-type N-terminal cleavage/methylation domain-containing protein
MNYLKTNNKWSRQRGTTLIELSVVIAVILLLVGVLFIGVTAWKEGANRAACILNISTIQKAMRNYENSNELAIGAACTIGTLTGATNYFAVAPKCPSSNTAYTDAGAITPVGTVFATCTNGTPHVPNPASTTEW